MLGLNRRALAGVGVALAMAVAGVGSIALADGPAPTPTATTSSSTSTTTTTTTQKTDYSQVFLGKLAAALGVSQSKVESAIKKAEGDTIDQAVANGDLAKNPADAMKQRVQQNPVDLFHLKGVGGRGIDGTGRGGFGHGAPAASIVDQATLQKAVADKLGLSVTDFQSKIQSGSTLASLAKEKNVQVQDLYDAAANAAKPLLDQAVKDGKITQAQADEVYKEIQQGGLGIGRFGGMREMKGGRGSR